MKVVQYTPTIAMGDAVSNDVRAIDKLLKQMGLTSRICVNAVASRLQGETFLSRSQLEKLKEDDVLIYHHSIACDNVALIRNPPCRKIMIYHNITPSEYFTAYDVNMKELCRRGRQELDALRGCFDYCLADSEYNRQELIEAGYTCPIDVLPILIPFEDYEKTPDAATVAAYRDGWTNILFVGRNAPNKKIENVIRAFDCYKKTLNPKSRLILVGSTSVKRYMKRLSEYMEKNDIQDVVFPGHISFAQILAFYKAADVFLCMSEHEGFCVPLLEAMYFDVPVIAYRACAVPYTLGGSGILLEDNSPELAAAAIDRLVNDEALRKNIIAGQRRRLNDFSYENVSRLFIKLFQAFLNSTDRGVIL